MKLLHSVKIRAVVMSGESSAPQSLSERIRKVRSEAHLIDVVVWDPLGTPELVRQALQAGAADVILSSRSEALARAVLRIVNRQRFLPKLHRFDLARSKSARFEGLVSKSERMWELFRTVTQVAPSGASVLILGETGVGKELLARAIHKHSGRSGRFVAVNCGAIPENLIESELFGHEEGTFTGATRNKKGLFRSANGGTLLLDEIGNLPLTSQYSLLRALQEEAVRPVGGSKEIPVDVRIIAATSVGLDSKAHSGLFRADLLFRLDVIRLVILPLRKRPEDILHLFGYFKRKIAKRYGLVPPEPTEDFLEDLLAYYWPGNVRELENVSERLVLTHHGKKISKRQFEPLRRPRPRKQEADPFEAPMGSASSQTNRALDIDTEKSLKENLAPAVERLERAYFEKLLTKTGGSIGATARRAGISPRTLLRKLKGYGIDKNDFRIR